MKEAEVSITQTLQDAVRGLSETYTFGYHTKEDIAQQGMVYGLEALEDGRYDVTRPLDAFLYTHMKNRLFNYKRNNYLRTEPPCPCCNMFDPPPNPCDRWKKWYKRNSAKQNLMRPLDVASINDDGESNMGTPSSVVDEAHLNDVLRMIDEELDPGLRPDYLRMRADQPVSKVQRLKVRAAIQEILEPEQWQ